MPRTSRRRWPAQVARCCSAGDSKTRIDTESPSSTSAG